MKNTAIISLIVHPQAENIRNQNRQMQTELARLIVERDNLRYSVIPNITAEYQVKLGALEWRVFQLDCEVRAFIRRIEMAQVALNRGEEPVYKSIETEIEIEFAAWCEKIKRQAQEIKSAQERENAPVMSFAESKELKTLYRKLALLLHEDIIGKTDERRRKFWLQAVEAYKCGDLQTLRTIRLLIGSEIPETVSADESLSVMEILNNRNAELKRICENLLDEITAIKTTAPYILHEILDDAAELEQQQTILREQIETMREKRFQLTEHWAEIMRFAADRENIEIPVEPPDIFADDEFWAEIIYEF